jgi:photoactive yellow protein
LIVGQNASNYRREAMSENYHFDAPKLLDALESLVGNVDDVNAFRDFDDLELGLIVMDRSGGVVGYNRVESQRAGLRAEKVLGRNFFTSVGPCTDNPLIAGRFRQDTNLDEYLDFTFAFRMMLAPVRLRLLAKSGSAYQFLVIVPR